MLIARLELADFRRKMNANALNPALSRDIIIPILLDLTLIYALLCMYLDLNGSSIIILGFSVVILLLLLLDEYELHCVFMVAFSFPPLIILLLLSLLLYEARNIMATNGHSASARSNARGILLVLSICLSFI